MNKEYTKWIELINDSVNELENAGIEAAGVEVSQLICHVFKMSLSDYVMCKRDSLKEADADKLPGYLELLNKRVSRIPLSQVLGERDFCGFTFKVNEHVLTPRFETEELVSLVAKQSEGKSILDLCTGSGCIAISLALLGKPKKVTASDISDEALKVAKKNASNLLDESIDFTLVKSDLFENLDERFDIIVSNPPYIQTEEVLKLDPEVRDHEPHLALDGGTDGLDIYKRIIAEAKDHLNNGGKIFFEIGFDEGKAVSDLLTNAGFDDVKVIKDLSGNDRIVSAKIPEQ